MTSALIAVACMGPIAAGTLTDASFTQLLQVSAVLFFIGAISGVTIINPPIPLSVEQSGECDRGWAGVLPSESGRSAPGLS